MTVTVSIVLNGVRVPVELDDAAVATIAAAVTPPAAPQSPLMTVVEAADLLRCKRARVDDLLSAGRLQRVKDGARTLIRRADVEAYLRTVTP